MGEPRWDVRFARHGLETYSRKHQGLHEVFFHAISRNDADLAADIWIFVLKVEQADRQDAK